MTDLEKFEKYVHHFANCLGIKPEWQIWVTEVKKLGEHNELVAACVVLLDSRLAWIRLNKDRLKEKEPRLVSEDSNHAFIKMPQDLKTVAAHEVVHIFEADFWNCADVATALVPHNRFGATYMEHLRKVHERQVFRWAKLVVKMFPIEEEEGGMQCN